MKDQLCQYVELLFAGTADSEDIKQEILQNTLDRYDDLIAEGKSPEAAYRLAIMGIGDINEILGAAKFSVHSAPTAAPISRPQETANDTPLKKLLRAVAVGLYILCPLPIIVLSEMGMENFGMCGTLSIIAVATVLMMLGAKKKTPENPQPDYTPSDPQDELTRSVSSLIWAIGLAAYFILSFTTMAWHITWVIFPIIAAVNGLVKAILDLKEANKQ